MQFLFFIKTSSDAVAAERPALQIDEWVDQMDSRGARVVGERLRPAADATTVRVRGGELRVGRSAEPDDIAGFDLIECADLDEAIEIARMHPMATQGAVEIRALWPWEG